MPPSMFAKEKVIRAPILRPPPHTCSPPLLGAGPFPSHSPKDVLGCFEVNAHSLSKQPGGQTGQAEHRAHRQAGRQAGGQVHSTTHTGPASAVLAHWVPLFNLKTTAVEHQTTALCDGPFASKHPRPPPGTVTSTSPLMPIAKPSHIHTHFGAVLSAAE